MRTLWIRAMERGFQLFFLLILWELLLVLLSWLLFNTDSILVQLLGDIALWSLLLLVLVPTPLITAAILPKAKKSPNSTDNYSHKLRYKRPIHFSQYPIKLACMVSDILLLQDSGHQNKDTYDDKDNTQYKPGFSHLVSPIASLLDRILSRRKKGVNTKRGEPHFAGWLS